VAKIMGNLLVSRRVEREDGQLSVKILVENHGDLARPFKLHELLAEKAETTAPEARVIPIGDGYDHHWKLSLAPGQKATLNYRIAAAGLSGILSLKEPVVEGLDAEIVRGARVI